MTKAGWIFVRNDGSGNPDMPDRVGGAITNPLDITRLTGGPGGQEHTHLLVGGIALPSDQIAVFHIHIVTDITGAWVQLTRPDSVPEHDHTLPLDGNGNLSPDWFLLFWIGSDADAAAIVADPNCLIACEAAVSEQGGQTVIGALDNTPWTAGERATWEARILNVLGMDLPDEVDRGRRLVQLFAGPLSSRANQTEMALRPTSA
jgi:hypothetical protein